MRERSAGLAATGLQREADKAIKRLDKELEDTPF